MFYRIVGLKKDSFVDKESSKTIEFRKLYLLDETDKKFDLGGLPFNMSINEEIYQRLIADNANEDILHKNIELQYDRFNKVCDYKLVNELGF